MENVPGKLCIYVAGVVGEELTMFQRSGAPPAVTAKRQPLEGIRGRLKTLTGKEYVN